MNSSYQHLAVFDVGKTNLKFSLLDAAGKVVYSKTRPNHVVGGPPYPHYDLEAMFAWLKGQMRDAQPQPQAIIVTTHGATGALLRGDELALPILDYEFQEPESVAYPSPDFSETASPALPGGLNLGRQLYWQQQTFSAEFTAADTFLMYPQYWAFRLSGVKATEVTSFGAHTDLWNPYKADFSSLVKGQGWLRLLPPTQPAWAVLGALRPEIALELGYTQPCDVLCGVHDSNASLVPYLGGDKPTVVSTGTWTISFVAGGSLEHLREDYDLLANVNIFAQAVPTARYMGGREFAAIVDGEIPKDASWADLEAVLSTPIFAIPSFNDQGGAFMRHKGYFLPEHPADVRQRFALASLYSALMVDLQLEWLGSQNDIFLEGSFSQNLFIPALLAALRPSQKVFVSSEASGTTLGAFYLAHWNQDKAKPSQTLVEPAKLVGLEGYQKAWREKALALLD